MQAIRHEKAAGRTYASMPGFTNDGFIGGAVGNGNGGINLSPGVGDANLPNWYGHDIATITITPVPEPSGLLALGMGFMGFASLLFKRR